MPANRNLGKSLAYRAFRAGRAAFADSIESTPSLVGLAMFQAGLKLDEFGVIEGHPLRLVLMSAIEKSVRPKAAAWIEEAKESLADEQFGSRGELL